MNIGEYLPRLCLGKYSPIFTSPSANNIVNYKCTLSRGVSDTNYHWSSATTSHTTSYSCTLVGDRMILEAIMFQVVAHFELYWYTCSPGLQKLQLILWLFTWFVQRQFVLWRQFLLLAGCSVFLLSVSQILYFSPGFLQSFFFFFLLLYPWTIKF